MRQRRYGICAMQMLTCRPSPVSGRDKRLGRSASSSSIPGILSVLGCIIFPKAIPVVSPEVGTTSLPMAKMQQRIDFHCHAIPPGYRQYAIDCGHEKPDGMPALPVRFVTYGIWD